MNAGRHTAALSVSCLVGELILFDSAGEFDSEKKNEVRKRRYFGYLN